jgi:hypothetical protein
MLIRASARSDSMPDHKYLVVIGTTIYTVDWNALVGKMLATTQAKEEGSCRTARISRPDSLPYSEAYNDNVNVGRNRFFSDCLAGYEWSEIRECFESL